MLNRWRGVLLLLASYTLLVESAIAQSELPTRVTSQNRAGDLPFSSSVGTDVEHVDLASGALNVTIPLIKIPGRGIDAELYYRWNSNYFLLAPRTDSLGNPYYLWTIENSSGWQTNHTNHTFALFNVPCTDYANEGKMSGWNSFIYTDPSGSQHPQAIQTEFGLCAGPGDPSGPDLTAQGMRGTANASSSTIVLADGSKEDYQDSNGNQENNTTPIDTLGRAFYSTQTTKDGNGNVTQIKYTFTDSNGTAQTYTVNWQLITVTTSFGASSGGYGITKEILGSSWDVVSNIVLPNGQKYVFKYTDPYGEISEIDLPTGGVITYTWANLSDTRQTRRYVSSRTETINGVQATWNFSVSVVTPFYSYSSTVTYPLAGSPPAQNQSVFASSSGAITNAKIYAGSATGTPMREYRMVVASDTNPFAGETCYNDLFPPPWDGAQPVGMRVSSITTILEDGLTQSKKQFDYEPLLQYTYHPRHCGDHTDNNTGVPYTTSRGNVATISEYDWGQGAPGPLIRRIDKTYLHNSNGTYTTYNIVDRVLQETSYDSTSNTCQGAAQPCAQTQYEYDNYVAGVNAMVDTSGARAPQHDYTNYSSAFIYRGNVTRVKRWRNTDSQLLTTIYTYDDLGNIRVISDPLTHNTSYGYTDRWSGSSCPPTSNSYAYVTAITNPLAQQVNRTYFQCSGLLQARQDQNDINASRAGTTYSYDSLRRVTLKKPDIGQVSSAYNDVPPASATTTTTIAGSLNMTSVAVEDGLGRVTQTQVTSDPDGTTFVDAAYDVLGRKLTVSNPHRSASLPTDGTTTYGYDAISRVPVVTQPDGSQISTSYVANCATVTDEAGKKRKSCSDGLGRLTKVFEDPSVLNYETDYTYDVLGDLLTVNQKGGDSNSAHWRPRTFVYNSLSQLLSATNPESGVISYAYDNGGRMTGRTAPKPNQTSSATVVTTYSYDSGDRLTQKSYNDGSTATVKFGYDGVALSGCTTAPPTLTDSNPAGYRTSMCDASGGTSWNHDAMGQALNDKRTIVGTSAVTNTVTYTYNLDGSMATLTYPNTGKVITYSAGGAGRPLAAQDVAGGINYVQNAQYAPFGGLTSMTQGATPITTTDAYNKRLQPVTLSAATGAATILSLSYDFHLGAGDNGNVFQIVNNRDNNRTQNFTYDGFNRISQANTTGPNWGEAFTIDPWANLTNRGPVAGKTNYELLNASPASVLNQLPGYGYDAAGNLTSNGSAAYTYDGENRLLTTAGVTYTYDGDGKRVKKSNGTLYWTGTGGDALSESDLSGAIQKEYIFFAGKRVTRRDVPGTPSVKYYFSDHLGSASVITNASGTMPPLEESDYYPYGGEIVVTNGDPNQYKFTGKERDAESGLDEFGARYYASSLGRFMIPDWAAKPTDVPYASFGNPQSLNLYSYVNNNPTTTRDPDGHETQDTLDPQAAKEAGNTIAGAFTGLARMAVGTWNTAADLLNAQTGYGLPTLPMPQYENKDQAIAGAAAQLGTVVYSAVEGATAGSVAKTVEAVPDANVVVRGGTAEMPPAGTTFSGAHGATLEEAGSGVPHGTIRTTTAGEVRGAGGTVHSAPEPTRSGVMNDKHVNVTEGANKPSTFSQPRPNPVPKKDRVQ